jgi:hypothetical protein
LTNLSTFLVLLFTFQMAQSQVTELLTEKSRQDVYDFYSLKAKKQKTTGWILLGTGLAATVGGYAIMANNFDLFDSDSDGGLAAGTGLFLVGSIVTIASIPVLIVSGSNNRKARAYLETGTAGVGNFTFDNSKYVSIDLKIDF